MIEMYLTLVIILIAILTLLMNHYNRKQAEALDTTAQAVMDWLYLEIQRNRAQKMKEVQVKDPLGWFGKQARCSVQKVERVFSQVPALELAVTGGYLVVSPLEPARFRSALKIYSSTSKTPAVLKESNVPLLRYDMFRRPRADVSSVGLQENEWFDLEAQLALSALGLEWGKVNRLWFYHVDSTRR